LENEEIEEWEEWKDWMEEIILPSEIYRSIYMEWMENSSSTTSFIDELNDESLDELAYKACDDYDIDRSIMKAALEDRLKDGYLLVMLIDGYWRDISMPESPFMVALSEFVSGRNEYGEDGAEIESRYLWTRVILYLEKKRLVPVGFVALFLLSDTRKFGVEEMMNEIEEYTNSALRLFHLCRMIKSKWEDGELYEKEKKQMKVVKGIIRRLVRLNGECVSKYHKIFWRLKIEKKTVVSPSHSLSSTSIDELSNDNLNWEMEYFFIEPSSLSLADLLTRSVNLFSFIDSLIFQDDLLSRILFFFPHLSDSLISSHLEDCTSRSSFNTLVLLSSIGIFPRGFLTLILLKSHSSLIDSLHPIIDQSDVLRRLFGRENGDVSEAEKIDVYTSIRSIVADSTSHLYFNLFNDVILSVKEYSNEVIELNREVDEWIGEQTTWKSMRDDKEWRILSGETDSLNETGAWDICVKKLRDVSVTFLSRINSDLFNGRLIPFIISNSPGYKGITEELIENPLSSLAYRILMYTIGSDVEGEGIPSLFVYLSLRKIIVNKSSMDEVIKLMTPIVPFVFPRIVGMKGREMREVSRRAGQFVLGSLLPSTTAYLRQWPELLSTSFEYYRNLNRNAPPLISPIDDSSFWKKNMRLFGDYSMSLIRSQIRERSWQFFTALNNDLFSHKLVKDLKKWFVNKERLKGKELKDIECDGCYLVLLSLSIHFFPRGFFYLVLTRFDSSKLSKWAMALKEIKRRFIEEQNNKSIPDLLLYDEMRWTINGEEREDEKDLIKVYGELFGVEIIENGNQSDDDSMDESESKVTLVDGKVVTFRNFTLLRKWKKLLRDRVIPSLDILLLRSVDIVAELDEQICNGKLLSILKPLLKTKGITVSDVTLSESLSGHAMEILSIIDSINVFPPGFIYLMLRDYADETVDEVIDQLTTKETNEYIEKAIQYLISSSEGEEKRRIEYERILSDRLNEMERNGVDYARFFPSIDPDIEEIAKASWTRKEKKDRKKKKKKRKRKNCDEMEEKRKKIENEEKAEMSEQSIIDEEEKDTVEVNEESNENNNKDEWDEVGMEIDRLLKSRERLNEEEKDKIHYEKMVKNKSIINMNPSIDESFKVFAIGRNCEIQKKWEETKKEEIERLTEKIHSVFDECCQKPDDLQKKYLVYNELCRFMRPHLNQECVGMFLSGSTHSLIASTNSNLDVTITGIYESSVERLYEMILPHITDMCHAGSVFLSNSSHSATLLVVIPGCPSIPVTFHFTKRTPYFSCLISAYSRIDRRFPLLFLYLKQWSTTVFDPSDGVSSYVLASLLIHYLHCGLFPPILPCLPVLYPARCTPDPYGKFDTDHILIGGVINCNDLSPGILLIRFFLYYCNFPFNKFIISIRRGGIIHKSSHKENLPLICIEDPFDQSLDLDRSLNPDRFIEKMKEALEKLYVRCQLF
ncbi:hypothetical protein PFISCL1PPCAC_1928, partial [Pristionchus fissidentatus]